MATSGLRLLEWRVWRQPEGFSLSGLRGTARASRVGGSAMPGACALLRFDHQLEVGRSWAKRPHAAARARFGCAHSGCAPFFAISWQREQAPGLGPSSPARSTLSPPVQMHRVVWSAVNWTAMRNLVV